MKILIDENLDIRLRHLFPHYEAYTVEYMGWKGLPNGDLLDKADGAGFALLITGDTKMFHQQTCADCQYRHWQLTETVPWTMPTKQTFEGRLTGISDDPALGR